MPNNKKRLFNIFRNNTNTTTNNKLLKLIQNIASFLGITTLSPLWNNIACALLTVLYIKIVLDIASMIREKLGLNADISRKFIHICAGCWILFWPLFDVTHWSWRLNILVPSVMSVKLFYKVRVSKQRFRVMSVLSYHYFLVSKKMYFRNTQIYYLHIIIYS